MVVFANTFYNICTKSAPASVNAFCVCLVAFLSMSGGRIAEEFDKLNWTAPVLGVAIIGLEMGYIFIYRAGGGGGQPGRW